MDDILMNYFFEVTVSQNISLLYTTEYRNVHVHSDRFKLSMIKHLLFINMLSVKYVHPSQRGQQAVKHIKCTLGPGLCAKYAA